MILINTWPVIIVAPTCFGLVLSKQTLSKLEYLFEIQVLVCPTAYLRQNIKHERDKMSAKEYGTWLMKSYSLISGPVAVDHFHCLKVVQGWSIPYLGIEHEWILESTNWNCQKVSNSRGEISFTYSNFSMCCKRLLHAFSKKFGIQIEWFKVEKKYFEVEKIFQEYSRFKWQFCRFWCVVSVLV